VRLAYAWRNIFSCPPTCYLFRVVMWRNRLVRTQCTTVERLYNCPCGRFVHWSLHLSAWNSDILLVGKWLLWPQWRSQPRNLGGAKNWEGAKIFDFRRITLFCLEKRLSKHTMTIFCKIFWGHGPFVPLATPM